MNKITEYTYTQATDAFRAWAAGVTCVAGPYYGEAVEYLVGWIPEGDICATDASKILTAVHQAALSIAWARHDVEHCLISAAMPAPTEPKVDYDEQDHMSRLTWVTSVDLSIEWVHDLGWLVALHGDHPVRAAALARAHDERTGWSP